MLIGTHPRVFLSLFSLVTEHVDGAAAYFVVVVVSERRGHVGEIALGGELGGLVLPVVQVDDVVDLLLVSAGGSSVEQAREGAHHGHKHGHYQGHPAAPGQIRREKDQVHEEGQQEDGKSGEGPEERSVEDPARRAERSREEHAAER